ncbi:sugar ABC transporter ATP-binding protein [Subtercola endophyticus]|uniref:sugar ABC transporter ATP-binding protein n=1 Tax=Subtercola endophyticus TaxID=2895559 RepID=UPI001E625DAE|nr:sugar ABC transporter ATP-binding protein [Subtercola endophyticus]UFS57965.1 sugar ABC transporter ATP-binding protein [Subtercola endophyticus]
MSETLAPSSVAEPTTRIALSVQNLTKSYGGAVALEDVSLTVNSGEVHALLGQNGCGKSTLIKCLTGVEVPDGGHVDVFGETLVMPTIDPHTRGIAVIHQDIGLVESMTVLENLGINARYGTRLLAPVNVKKEKAIYAELMHRLGVQFDLDAEVSTLSPAERALLAVARAMRLMDGESSEQLFILDEPTAALSKPEAARLLALMRRVADLGAGVIFVSHRLSEVMEVCDRATVMRAGRDIVDVAVAETTRSELVAHMLGRRMDDFFPEPPHFSGGPTRLAVTELSGERVSKVSFEARGGEVLGITGLAGMGQEELPFLLCGEERSRGGNVSVDGVPANFSSPTAAIQAGVALVPGNRLRDGIWIAGTAEENVTLPVIGTFSRFFNISTSDVRRRAGELMQRVDVQPNRPDYVLASFSGGNQQKIVFAKWLQLHPGVLLLDEPTQGVDPGAAKALLGDAMAAAAEGSAVVVFSGDHEQLAAICHRVIVLHHGQVIAELERGPALTEHALLEACEAGPSEVSIAA